MFVEPVSRKRTCKVGPGRFIPQYRRIKIRLVTASKLSNQCPQQLCSTRAWNLRIDLAHDATVGDRSRNSKNFYASPRSIYGENQQRERWECIFIPLKIAKRKRYYERGWWSRTRSDSDRGGFRSKRRTTAPPRSTHVQPGDVSSFLIQQGGRRS